MAGRSEFAVRVTGRSMLPFLPPGSVVRMTRLLPPGDLFGRVALLQLRGRPVLHRVIRDAGRHVVTRGDASTPADPPVPRARLLGVATAVLAAPSPFAPLVRFAVERPRPAGALALVFHPLARLAGQLDDLLHLLRGR